MSHEAGEQLINSIPSLYNTNHQEVGQNQEFEVFASMLYKIHTEQLSNRL